jgi:uncharacterized protein YyaL (SSP411 family)
MRSSDGKLLRTCSPGGGAKLNGYLEDYAYLVEGLVTLHEATFEPRWLSGAVEFAGVMVDQFWDDVGGGFFYTGKDHESLIARTKDPHDNATPSANAVAVTALQRLMSLTGRTEYREKIETNLRLYSGLMSAHPSAVGQMLLALDFHIGPEREYAVVGNPADDETRRVLRALRTGFRPNKVVALKKPGDDSADGLIALLAGKTSRGPVTTYVCENYACKAPLVGAEAVEKAVG